MSRHHSELLHLQREIDRLHTELRDARLPRRDDEHHFELHVLTSKGWHVTLHNDAYTAWAEFEWQRHCPAVLQATIIEHKRKRFSL